jgi:hypothetical protein
VTKSQEYVSTRQRLEAAILVHRVIADPTSRGYNSIMALDMRDTIEGLQRQLAYMRNVCITCGIDFPTPPALTSHLTGVHA